MQGFGIIGLGRMGANMARRLHRSGITPAANNRDPKVVDQLESEGVIRGARSYRELVSALERPRSIWIMVPAAVVDQVIDELLPLLDPDDTIIDGGNSHYPLDIARAPRLAKHGVHYLDVGTSGGVHGLDRGYCLMIGGPEQAVHRLVPVFEALASGLEGAERTAGREGPPDPAERGWYHCGPAGAGHFVKMVHNGIEYAIMQAYAEGFNLLSRAGVGRHEGVDDAETAPLANPDHYQYEFELAQVAELWRRGSVIGSWLLDLTAEALHRGDGLDRYEGYVSDSGEGRWTALAAIETGTPAPTIVEALFSRFSSRDNDLLANQVLSAMRSGFGGHAESAIRPDSQSNPEERP